MVKNVTGPEIRSIFASGPSSSVWPARAPFWLCFCFLPTLHHRFSATPLTLGFQNSFPGLETAGQLCPAEQMFAGHEGRQGASRGF